MSDPFIGEVQIYGFDYAPRDWALCNGALLSISQNQTLYAIIGDMYGGDGRSSMAVPDLRGRIPMQPRQGPGLTPRFLTERLGLPKIPLSGYDIPGHTHDAKCVKIAGTSTSGNQTMMPGLYSISVDDVYRNNPTSESEVNMSEDFLQVAGSGQAHYNMQPYLTLNFCICLLGIFPSRN